MVYALDGRSRKGDISHSKNSGGRDPDQSSGFRPDIEGLRGIAVLLVVLFHCGLPGIPGGFVGVDVFFVLSGFLITRLLVAEIQETSSLNLMSFYARRARRLLPAFAFTSVTTLLVGAMFLAPNELDWAGRAGQAAALYMSNVFFDKNAGDYFGPDVQSNPLLHTWSLAVEEQFYLFWPLLISLTIRWCQSRNALIAVLCGVTLISLYIGVEFTAKNGTLAFYELPARAWEFGIGGLTALLPYRRLKLAAGWRLAVGWLGLFMILGAAHFLSIVGGRGFPGWVALIPTLGTAAALIAGTASPQRGVSVVLATAPLQWIGRLSYSWYLWHWPFLVFATALLPAISTSGKIAAAVASLAIATISYHFVERPIRFHPILLKRPTLSIGLAGIVTICSLGFATASIELAGQLAKQPRIQTITTAIGDISRLRQNEQCISRIQSPEVKTCEFGNRSSDIHIVLFGDSHAIQWFNPLERIAEANGWKLTTIVKSACPAFDITLSTQRAHRAACDQWRAAALVRIMAMHPTLVLLGNRTNYRGQEDRGNSPIVFSLDELRDGTRRTLQALMGLRVAIMRDTPYFPYDIPTCLARSVRHSWYPGGLCELDRSAALNPAIFMSEQAGTRGLHNIHLVDVTDLICQTDTCKPIQGERVVYRDKHHLAGQFADSLTPALAQALHTIFDSGPPTGS